MKIVVAALTIDARVENRRLLALTGWGAGWDWNLDVITCNKTIRNLNSPQCRNSWICWPDQCWLRVET